MMISNSFVDPLDLGEIPIALLFVGSPGDPLGPLNVMSLLASLAIGFIAWQAWTARPRAQESSATPSAVPPDDLHPAFAGALASGRVRDSQIEATVLELVRKRAVEIEPDHQQRDKVQLRILDSTLVTNPVEQTLMELLQRRSREGTVSYRDLSRLRNEWGRVRASLEREVIERGWLNPSLVQTRLPFVVPGAIGLVLAAATIPGAFVVSSGWPLIGGVIVGIVGSVVLIAGNIVPFTTRAGEEAAVPWRAFRTGLVTARDDGHDAIDLDSAFPYIVSMGMTPGFTRYLRRASQSGYIPTWIGPRPLVQEWPEGWYTYWLAFHTALGPTDPANTTAPSGSPWRRSLTGGRF
jgi:hypothetical protein